MRMAPLGLHQRCGRRAVYVFGILSQISIQNVDLSVFCEDGAVELVSSAPSLLEGQQISHKIDCADERLLFGAQTCGNHLGLHAKKLQQSILFDQELYSNGMLAPLCVKLEAISRVVDGTKQLECKGEVYASDQRGKKEKIILNNNNSTKKNN